MNAEKIQVGHRYLCRAIGLKETVEGEVISKFERCSILYVKNFDPCDKVPVVEKASKVVARYCDFISEA